MAYQPLLDAINNGKLGTQDSLEITYSISDFSSLLVQHPADKNKTVIKGTFLSVPLFNTEVNNAFFQWEHVLNKIYSSVLKLRFVKVDSDADIAINFLGKKTDDIVVHKNQISLNPNRGWSSCLNPGQYTVTSHLTIALSRFLGVNSNRTNSPLNKKNIYENFVKVYNLKVTEDSVIIKSSLSQSIDAVNDIVDIYGAAEEYPIIRGCMHSRASNYNPLATEDDGSCAERFARAPRITNFQSRYLAKVSNEYYFLREDGFNSLNAAFTFIPFTNAQGGEILLSTISGSSPNDVDTSMVITDKSGESLGMIKYVALFNSSGEVKIYNRHGDVLSDFSNYASIGDYFSASKKSLASNSEVHYLSDGNNNHTLMWKDATGKINRITLDDSLPQLNNREEVPDCAIDTFHYGNVVEQDSYVGTNNTGVHSLWLHPLLNTTNPIELYSAAGNFTYTQFEDNGQITLFATNFTTGNIMNVGVNSDLPEAGGTDYQSYFNKSYRITYRNGENNSEHYGNLKTFILPTPFGEKITSFSPFTKYLKIHTTDVKDYNSNYTFLNLEDRDTNKDFFVGVDNSYYPGITYVLELFKSVSDNDTFGDLGIFNIYNNNYNSETKLFSDVLDGYTPPTAEEVTYDAFTSEMQHYLSLPVSIGNKLLQSSQFNMGNMNSGAYTNVGSPDAEPNFFGNFHLAYAVKHGFLLFKINNVNARVEDTILHVFGGDLDMLENSHGFTPMCMVFSPKDNFLYTILENPSDPNERKIGIFQIQDGVNRQGASASSGFELIHTTSIIDNPFNGALSKITLGIDGNIYIWSADSAEFLRITEPDLSSSVRIFRDNPALSSLSQPAEHLPSTFKLGLESALINSRYNAYGQRYNHEQHTFQEAGSDLLTFNSAAYNSNLLLPGGVYNLQTRGMLAPHYMSDLIYNSTTQNAPNDVGNVDMVLGAMTTNQSGGVVLTDYQGDEIQTIAAKTIDVPNSIFIIPLNTQEYFNSYMVGYILQDDGPGSVSGISPIQGIKTYYDTIGYVIVEVDITPTRVTNYSYTIAGKGILAQNEITTAQQLQANKSLLPGIGICRFENYKYDILQCHMVTNNTSEPSLVRFGAMSLDEDTTYGSLDSLDRARYTFGDHIKRFSGEKVVEVHEHVNAASAIMSFSSDTTLLAIATNSANTEAKSIISIFEYAQGNTQEGTNKLGTVDISNLLTAKDVSSDTTYDLIPEFKVRSLEFSPDKTKLYILVGMDLDDMEFNSEGFVGAKSKIIRLEIARDEDGSSIGLSFGYGTIPETKDNLLAAPKNKQALFTSVIDDNLADAGNINLKKFTNMTGLTTDIEGQIYILNAFDSTHLNLDKTITSVLGFIADPDSPIYAIAGPTANVIAEPCSGEERNCSQGIFVIGAITDTSQNPLFVDNVLDEFYTVSRQIYGCTDSTAWNFDAGATQENGSCIYEIGPGAPAHDRQRPLYSARDGQNLQDCNASLRCPVLVIRPADYTVIKDLYGPTSGPQYMVGTGEHYNAGWDLLLHAGAATQTAAPQQGVYSHYNHAHPAISGYHILEPDLNANCCECFYRFRYESPGIKVEDGQISGFYHPGTFNPYNNTSRPGYVQHTGTENETSDYLLYTPTSNLYPFYRDFIITNHSEAQIDGNARYDNFQQDIWQTANFGNNPLSTDVFGTDLALESGYILSTLSAVAAYVHEGVVYYAFQEGMDVENVSQILDPSASFLFSTVTAGEYADSLVSNLAFVYGNVGDANQIVSSPNLVDNGASFLPAAQANIDTAHCRSCTDPTATNYEPPHPTIGCRLPLCLSDADSCVVEGCMPSYGWYYYTSPSGEVTVVESCETDPNATIHNEDLCVYPQGPLCSCENNTPTQPSSNATYNVHCNCDGDHPGQVWGVSPSANNLVYITPCDCDGGHLLVKNHFYSTFKTYVEGQMTQAVSNTMNLLYPYTPYTYNDVKDVLGAGFFSGNQSNPTGTDVCQYQTYYGNFASTDIAYKNLTRGCGFYVDSSTDTPTFEGGPNTLLPGFTFPEGICNCNGDHSSDLHGPNCNCDGEILNPNHCSCKDGAYELYYPDPDGDNLIECPTTGLAIKMCPERNADGNLTGNKFEKDNPSNVYTAAQINSQFIPIANLTSCETCTNENDVNTDCQCFEGTYDADSPDIFIQPQVVDNSGNTVGIANAINIQADYLYPEVATSSVADLEALGYEVLTDLNSGFHMPIQDCGGNCYLIVDDANTITGGEANTVLWKRNPSFGTFKHNTCGQCVAAEEVNQDCCVEALDACGNCTTDIVNKVIGAVGNATSYTFEDHEEFGAGFSMGSVDYIDENGEVQSINRICNVCNQVTPGMTTADIPEHGFNQYFIGGGVGSDLSLGIYADGTGTCNGCYNDETRLYLWKVSSPLYDSDGVATGETEDLWTGFYRNNITEFIFNDLEAVYPQRFYCSACDLNNVYENESQIVALGSLTIFGPQEGLFGELGSIAGEPNSCCEGFFYSECAYENGGCVPIGTNVGVKGCDGICGSGTVEDECGECGGTGINPDTGCCGDGVKGCHDDETCYPPDEVPVVDPCGTCGGTATLSDCTGCTDPNATNYSERNIFDDGSCNFLYLYGDVLQDAEISPNQSTGSIAEFFLPVYPLLFMSANLSSIFEVAQNFSGYGYSINNSNALGGNVTIDNPYIVRGKVQDIRQNAVGNGSIVSNTQNGDSVSDNTIIRIENPLENAEITYRYSYEYDTNYGSTSGTISGITGTQGSTDVTIYEDYIIPGSSVGEASVIPKYYFLLREGLLTSTDPLIIFASYLDKIQYMTPSVGDVFEHIAPNGNIITLPTHILCGNIKSIDQTTGLTNDVVLGLDGFTDEYVYNGNTSTGELEPQAQVQYNRATAYMIYEVIPAKDPDGNYYQFNMDVLLYTQGYVPPECIFFNNDVTGLRIEFEIPQTNNPSNTRFVIYDTNNRIVHNFTELSPIETNDPDVKKYLLNLSSLDGCYYFLPIGFKKDKDWSVSRLRIMNGCNILHYLDYGSSSTSTGAALINTNSRNTCEYGCFSPDQGILVTDHCYATVRKDVKEMTQITLTLQGGASTNLREDDFWINLKVLDLDTGEELIEIDTEEADPPDLIQTFSIYQTTRLGVDVFNPGLLSFKYELTSEYGEVIISKTYD